MADAARKAVLSTILDVWSRGPSLLPLLTNLGPVVRGGDSVDIPSRGSATVNTSESGSVEASSYTVDTLTVNRPKFINRGITQAQYAQLLNGGGAVSTAEIRGGLGDLANSIERDVIEYMLTSLAGTAASYHGNLAADDLTAADIDGLEASMRETDGLGNVMEGLFWVFSPRAMANVTSQGLVDYTPTEVGQAGRLGIKSVGLVNNIPTFVHSAVPGAVNRYSVATTAVSVTSNVATATVASGHGFVAGQMIYTTGLTQNVDVASPTAITATTSTSISYALTGSDGALADGIGTIASASAMGMLCYAPWLFYAMDGEIPFSDLVKREANAGWTLQLFQHLGRAGHAGAVRVLHAPDGS